MDAQSLHAAENSARRNRLAPSGFNHSHHFSADHKQSTNATDQQHNNIRAKRE